MPIKYFLDKDGNKLDIEETIEKGLLSDYYPLAYLKICAKNKKWEGKPSVTQCLSGTREAFLKLVCGYAIDPKKSAFKVLGTKVHKTLEDLTPGESKSEVEMMVEDITGTVDLLEQQYNEDWWLVDYKTSGSYVVAKALGMVKKIRPAFDNSGNPILYKKSGKWGKEGEQKNEEYWELDVTQSDMKDWILQLNMYRIIAEKVLNLDIRRMKIFSTVRDGGCFSAKNRGIIDNVYYIDVPFLPDKDVEDFFKNKADKLLLHLKKYKEKENLKDSIPKVCTEEECWNGNKCLNFCEVSEFCKQIGDNHYLYDD